MDRSNAVTLRVLNTAIEEVCLLVMIHSEKDASISDYFYVSLQVYVLGFMFIIHIWYFVKSVCLILRYFCKNRSYFVLQWCVIENIFKLVIAGTVNDFCGPSVRCSPM